MDTKAQGLPITTIIIAALGILVLVIIGAIFGSQIFKFGRVTGECPGTCVVKTIPSGAGTAMFAVRPGGECNEFETAASGVYIPKNLPANIKETVATYRCDVCCVPIG